MSCIEGWVDDDEYEEALCMWNVDCGVLMIIGVEWVSWNVSKELLIGDYRMVCGWMTLSDEIDETMDYWRMNDAIVDNEVMMDWDRWNKEWKRMNCDCLWD